MLTYCSKCVKQTYNVCPKKQVIMTNIMIMQSKCAECGIKKSRFVKKQEAKRLLSNLGIKTPLSKIPLFNVLF